MAAFDFPNSPSNGDTYSANGIDWIYNGSVWKKDATAGVKGQKGEIGVTGDKGQKGEKGDKGQKGEDNSTKGQKGEIGATGGTGGTGVQGDKGQKGETGAAASKGQKGEIGATGGTGGTGSAGSDGSDGDKGQKGEIGVTGTVFTSGTRMLFQQTTAPSGWTKDTGLNNRALRIVSGSVGSGGSNSFTGVLNSTVTTSNGSVSNHTLTSSQIPSHYHFAFRSGNHGQHRNGSPMTANNYPSSGSGAGNLYESYNIGQSGSVSNVGRTSSVGSGSGHNHGFTNPNFNLNVLYTDVIIAQKN